MGNRLRTFRAVSGAALALGVTLPASRAEAVDALTGQCGVSAGNTTSWAINSDGQLSVTLVPSGDKRVARFRFFGVQVDASTWGWDHYQYRYQVGGGNSFGPQSNEVIEFRRAQDPPRSGDLWDEYYSPDDHNSNIDGDAPVQWMDRQYFSPRPFTEIWVQAIFDVPNDPDPSCWTNAVK